MKGEKQYREGSRHSPAHLAHLAHRVATFLPSWSYALFSLKIGRLPGARSSRPVPPGAGPANNENRHPQPGRRRAGDRLSRHRGGFGPGGRVVTGPAANLHQIGPVAGVRFGVDSSFQNWCSIRGRPRNRSNVRKDGENAVLAVPEPGLLVLWAPGAQETSAGPGIFGTDFTEESPMARPP